MTLHYEYITRVGFLPGVTRHNILLRCLPSREAFQQVREESLAISAGFRHSTSVDGLGNRVVTAGTGAWHDSLEYVSAGVAEMSVYCIVDSSPHPAYRMPSPLTMPCQAMKSLLPIVTGSFLDDCMAVMHRVHEHIVYTQGVTDVLTTSRDVFESRKGVCQDYAHLMVSLCRCLGMHARYVCGLMKGEGQTHAWVEVHDGQCWYAFDPTNDTAVATGYIKLAHGRDALDCPVSRGVYVGVSQQTSHVSVVVEEV